MKHLSSSSLIEFSRNVVLSCALLSKFLSRYTEVMLPDVFSKYYVLYDECDKDYSPKVHKQKHNEKNYMR